MAGVFRWVSGESEWFSQEWQSEVVQEWLTPGNGERSLQKCFSGVRRDSELGSRIPYKAVLYKSNYRKDSLDA